jgi:hypothetical protein
MGFALLSLRKLLGRVSHLRGWLGQPKAATNRTQSYFVNFSNALKPNLCFCVHISSFPGEIVGRFDSESNKYLS